MSCLQTNGREAFRCRLFALLLLLVGLSAPAAALTRAEVLQRARDWVNVGMPYCQCPNYGTDRYGYCGGRPGHPEWDAYRSDCSGLVSWAWGLPPPGRVTWTFAPYNSDASYEIPLSDLRPGDALNTNEGGNEHIALFVEWAGTNVVHVIEETTWRTPAHDSWWDVTPVGNTLVSWAVWHPIRSYDIAEDCVPHCEGSVVVSADCGRGDCSVYGANCVQDILGARCVFFACPPLGSTDACLPDGKTIIHCENGVPTSSADCSQYAAYCSTQGSGLAHCTSVFCANPGSTPVPHDICSLTPTILHCDATGQFTEDPCPPNTYCNVHPAPHCEPQTPCPPTQGESWACSQNRAYRCYSGNAFQVLDCPAQGEVCQMGANGKAACVGDHAGNPDPETPVDAGTPADAGTESDAGREDDAGMTEDAGLRDDAGPERDAGMSVDAGPSGGGADAATPAEAFDEMPRGGCACGGGQSLDAGLLALVVASGWASVRRRRRV